MRRREFHHAARRRGGRVAARGARAAGREEIYGRHSQRRQRKPRVEDGFFRCFARVGIGRRQKRRFRVPAMRRIGLNGCPRRGPGPTQGRYHCDGRNSRTVSNHARHRNHSDRHDGRWRSIGERARCQSGATRRRRHGDEPYGAGPGWEAARIVEDVVPRLSRMAVLWNAANPYSALVFKETHAGGQALGIEVQSLESAKSRRLQWRIRNCATRAPGCIVSGSRNAPSMRPFGDVVLWSAGRSLKRLRACQDSLAKRP
jgi:hypothetical protein